ncbi:hypothetical protein pb186bvf_011526 [Paramecium bursaria]
MIKSKFCKIITSQQYGPRAPSVSESRTYLQSRQEVRKLQYFKPNKLTFLKKPIIREKIERTLLPTRPWRLIVINEKPFSPIRTSHEPTVAKRSIRVRTEPSQKMKNQFVSNDFHIGPWE